MIGSLPLPPLELFAHSGSPSYLLPRSNHRNIEELFSEMASYVAGATDEVNNTVHLPKIEKRTYSSGSPTSSHGAAVPKCVCAPSTHAGSFKCRLHRVNYHGHSHRPRQLPQQSPAAAPSRTVVAL